MFLLFQNSMLMNDFLQDHPTETKQKGREMPWKTFTTLLKTWTASCLQSPNIPYLQMNFLFLYHMRQKKQSLPFYGWEMKQWLIPRGTGESSHLKCILLQGSLAGLWRAEKNKAIILKNPLSLQQWHRITQQAWEQQAERGRPEKRRTRRGQWFGLGAAKTYRPRVWDFCRTAALGLHRIKHHTSSYSTLHREKRKKKY